ncbi:pentapeptide repeat-containing protein [Streptomyces sp. NPDC058092]|uniref:pentapeptide repeat-containing protein n=1 Tax=Streptomyces sp. NPDC058092 TaxID=3346336 RepID=UPI0036E58F06
MNREYWSSAEGSRKADEILEAIKEGGDINHMAPGRFNGRLDLRGLHFRGMEDYAPDVTIAAAQGVSFTDIDFTGSTIPGLQLSGANVVNCNFDNAKMDGLECRGVIFKNCSFVKSSLRGAQLSLPLDEKYTTYDSVDFSRAILIGSNCTDAEFNRTTFTNAKLNSVNFRGSNFTDCKFAGLLRNVIFWSSSITGRSVPENIMRNVDFSQSILRDVEFRDIDLEEVVLPSGEPHIVVQQYNCTLARVLERLPMKGEPFTYGLRAYLAAELRFSHPERRVGIWHRKSLGKTSDEQEFAIHILKQAESECEAQEAR